jgi:hypothetical protein
MPEVHRELLRLHTIELLLLLWMSARLLLFLRLNEKTRAVDAAILSTHPPLTKEVRGGFSKSIHAILDRFAHLMNSPMSLR